MITILDQAITDHEHDNNPGSIHPGSRQQSRIMGMITNLDQFILDQEITDHEHDNDPGSIHPGSSNHGL